MTNGKKTDNMSLAFTDHLSQGATGGRDTVIKENILPQCRVSKVPRVLLEAQSQLAFKGVKAKYAKNNFDFIQLQFRTGSLMPFPWKDNFITSLVMSHKR